MLKHTPYIIVKREGKPPLDFYAHSFFHSPICSFVLYLCDTPVDYCYSSSTPTIVMIICLFCCTQPSFPGLPSVTIQLHPGNKPSHPPEGSAAHKALKLIIIVVQHLSDWRYTCTSAKQTQTITACIRAINTHNTLTNGKE